MLNKIFSKHFNVFRVLADKVNNFIKLPALHWTEAMHENLLYNFLFVWLFNCLLTCWIWYDCYSSVLFLCFVSTYILIISFSFLFHLNCIKCAWLWVFPDSENTSQKKSVFWYNLHNVIYLFIYLYIYTLAIYIYIYIYIIYIIYMYVSYNLCNHESNVLFRLLPQWLCCNSSSGAQHVRFFYFIQIICLLVLLLFFVSFFVLIDVFIHFIVLFVYFHLFVS